MVGKITYKYEEIEYTTDLIAGENVEESKTLEKTLKILIVVTIIYIIYSLKKSNKKYGNHGKNIKKNIKLQKILSNLYFLHN